MSKECIFFIGQNPHLVNDLLLVFRDHPQLRLHICIDYSKLSQSIKRLHPKVMLLETDLLHSEQKEQLENSLNQKGIPPLLFIHYPGSFSEHDLSQAAIRWGAFDIVNIQTAGWQQNILQKIEVILPLGRRTSLLHKTQSLLAQKPTGADSLKSSLKGLPLRLILLGASTGGPEALSAILPQLPAAFPVPIVVVQHLSANWASSLTERLDAISLLKVREAESVDKLEAGHVLVIPGHQQVSFEKNGQLELFHHVEFNHPSIDLALGSAANVFGSQTLAVILTGMGNDGLEGVRKLKQVNGKCFAEHASSCIVYGMPKAVVEAKLADKIIPLDKMAGEIIRFISS